ncbi:NF-kappa-B inhibitor alpha-like [Styela clava]|uniref:NF-kappa-B inhibitor alpha-like isoform X1 n=1 Tax=Styela clava TaxID=7725 RepID=UPI00193973A3|nr:NF-kappa-B inhibitor alpha-like isoform X1 [Styela clava]
MSNINTSHYMPSQSHDDFHDDQKCASITDENFDSGLGSITLSEIENLKIIDEKLGETNTMCQGQQQITTEEKKQTTEEFEPERLESIGYRSMQPEDELYARYIPDGGLSALHTAILEKNIKEIVNLIQECPDPKCLNYFTTEVHTSLHLAVYANLPEVVRFLIVYGADFNSKDKRGNTPLHTACEHGRLSCVRMILSPLDGTESIGLQESNLPQNINDKNYEGLTPLHLATINNQVEVVNFLVRQPIINLNIGDSTYGRTALHHALERRHSECFYILLKMSANVNATTYDGCSPLHLAVGYELEQETRYLMTRGASVTIETADETRPWDLARTQKIKDALNCSMMMQLRNLPVKQR